jgi:hypothetical protein
MTVIERTIQCTTCRGSGEEESSDSTDDRIYKCWACDGTGMIADRRKPDPALQGAVSALEKVIAVADLEASGDDTLSATWVATEARKALGRLGGQ